MNAREHESVSEAADILRKGGVIVYPTETVYGIGCDPWNREAVGRIFRIKRRAGGRTMLVIADSLEMAEREFGVLAGAAARLAKVFWPGPLTMIVRPAHECPDYLLGTTGGIAVRVTGDPFCRALVAEFGRPVVSTSANLSGEPAAITFREAYEKFGNEADLVIKGNAMTGIPSTVVDMTSGNPHIMRIGAISDSRIMEAVLP